MALPKDHPLSHCDTLLPQQIAHEPQVVFNYDMENSFGQWASGEIAEERIVCTVNTAQAALDLVASGVGVCVLSDQAAPERDDICRIPLSNWHQALYMCILYDKWLEPPVWTFVEGLVKILRDQAKDRQIL